MGFFKKVLKAATTTQQTTYRPPQNISGSSITFVSPEVVVQFDPQGWNDLLGPTAGTLKPMPTLVNRKISLDIVGEAFRQGNVSQVQAHYQDSWFPIYLALDPDNPHDKNAVAVCVGNAQVGFVDKGDARTWAKLVKTANEAGRLIVGEAHCKVIQSTQGPFWGVEGYVWFGRIIAPEFDPANAKKLTPAAFTKATEKVQLLLDEADDPETASQARALARKAGKAALPICSHATWMAANSDEDSRQAWQDVIDACEDLFEECEADAFSQGEDIDADLTSVLENLTFALEDLQATE